MRATHAEATRAIQRLDRGLILWLSFLLRLRPASAARLARQLSE